MKKFTTIGTVLKGKLHIGNKAEMDEFFREVKDGKKVIIEMDLQDKKAGVPAKVYFNKVIIPAFQRGFLKFGDVKSELQMRVFIMGECPHVDTFIFNDIGSRELSLAIDWAKQYAAENLGINISD